MITSILDGSISKANFVKENYFGLNIPISLTNVDDNVNRNTIIEMAEIL